jgi:RNA polymerase sigma factor (TIGR02999 family)
MEITTLLRRLHVGDRNVMHEVMPLVYNELKKLARSHLRHEGGMPLQTTSLVHEAFLKLAGSRHPSYENRAHFYGIASRLMRQVLVDTARARGAVKRGVGQEVAVADIPDWGPQPHRSVLAIEDALNALEKTDPLKVQLIEMRFFGGMTAEETAEALSMPVHTVRRELRVARAWLRREISGESHVTDLIPESQAVAVMTA